MPHPCQLADLDQALPPADARTVVVGVGNELRGDDGVGPLIARKLAEALQGHPGQGWLTALDCGDVPENYLEPILATSPTRVVFCDAADFGGVPGEVRVFQVHELGGQAISTHNASLALLAKVLAASGVREQLLVGVQPRHCTFGSGSGSEVVQAAELVVQQLLRCATP